LCGGVPRDRQYGCFGVWREWGWQRGGSERFFALAWEGGLCCCELAAVGDCDVGSGLRALGLGFVPGPGLAPAGELLSFASPKESSQRKGDPAGCVPSLRSGQPAVLTFRGVSPKLASLKQGRALIRETLRSSAHPEGVDTETPSLRSAPNSQQPATKTEDPIPTAAGAKRLLRLGRAKQWHVRLPSPLAAPRSGVFRGSGLAAV